MLIKTKWKLKKNLINHVNAKSNMKEDQYIFIKIKANGELIDQNRKYD